MGKKRGQVTVFIVIGIFLLVAAAVFLYLKKDRTDLEIEQAIPEEFLPIKTFVEECMYRHAQQGVLLMGVQGGFITVPQKIVANPESYVSFSVRNPLITPYWYYLGENRVPSLDYMERELGAYVDVQLASCINNFADFRDKFFIRELGMPETRVTIAEDQVVLTTSFPVEASVKGEGVKTDIKLFSTAVPVRLKKVYDLAVDIFEQENQNLFLEDLTLELMTAGPNIPFSDIVFTCHRLRWKKDEIEAYLKNLLYYNLPRVKFQGTLHPPFQRPLGEYEQFRGLTPEDVRNGRYPRNAPPDLYDYYHFYMPLENTNMDLQASVYYEKDWNFLLNARPSQGNTLDASYGRGHEEYLKFPCVNAYHFTYDVVYPVQMVIRDGQSFLGNGYVFRYALPVMIDHNQGNKQFTAVTTFEAPEKDTDYCDEQRAEEYLIYAKDSATFFDIRGANVTFNCLNTFFCPLGSTALDGGAYRLRTPLPEFCKPGSIVVEKEGYVRTEASIPTGNIVLDVFLAPLQEVSFRVVKRTYENNMLRDEVSHLGDTERAFIHMVSAEHPEYAVYREYPVREETGATLPIIKDSATYSLDLILFDTHDNLLGGYRGNFTLTEAEAVNAQEIIFTAVAFAPVPKDDEELGEILFKIQDLQLVEKAKPVVR